MKYIKTTISGIAFFLFFLSCGNNTRNNSGAEGKAEVKKDSAGIEFAFIADNKYIIISDTSDSNWATGNPVLSKGSPGGAYAAITGVKTDSLPSKYQALLNEKFNVYSGTGKIFSAKIISFKLLAEYVPHFGQVQQWKGMDEGPKSTDEQIAADVWKTTPQHFLVAEFSIENKAADEDDFYFALPSGKSESVFPSLSSTKAAAIKNKIENLADQTKEYAAVQQEFVKNTGNKKSKWWKDEESNMSFVFFEINKGIAYATLNHVSGNPCGGDFYSEKFSIWKMEKDSLPSLLYLADGAYTTILATDIDQDNIPEFLLDDGFGNRSLLKKTSDQWTVQYSWKILFQDDPC